MLQRKSPPIKIESLVSKAHNHIDQDAELLLAVIRRQLMRPASLVKAPAGKTISSHSTAPRPQRSEESLKTTSIQRTGAAYDKSVVDADINRHKPAKLSRNRIPPPQRERILQKYVAGKSVALIAREENRNRESVTRIVRGDEVQALVREMRAQFYGLAFDAIDAVRHTLQQQKDGRVGYRILMNIGAVPGPAEAEANAFQARQPAREELTPYERVAAQDESGRIHPWGLALVHLAQERNKVFDTSLLTTAEILHNRTITAVINEMTGGQCLNISLSDSIEWNRLKTLAEEVLQGKRSVSDKEIVAVRKQYIG
jgi:hypothetical protein